MLHIIGLLLLLGLIITALKHKGKILTFALGLAIIAGAIWLLYEYPIQTIAILASIFVTTAIISKISDANLKRKIENFIKNKDNKKLIQYHLSKTASTKRRIIFHIHKKVNLHNKSELLPSLFAADFIDYMSKRSNSSATSIVEKTEIENHLKSIWNQDGLEQYTVSNIGKHLTEAKHTYSVSFESPNSTGKGKPIELVKLSTEPENDLFENAISLDEE
jgi:hypothetical protein